jgi:hypothetical protein
LGPFYVQKRPEADFGFGANFGTPFGSGSQLIFFHPRSYSATLGLDSIQLFGLGFSMFSRNQLKRTS